jgi:hypothetical protein
VTGGGVKPALDLAFAPRGQAKLPELVRQDIPEIGVTRRAPRRAARRRPTTAAPHRAPPATAAPKKKSGCGCQTDGRRGRWAGAGLAAPPPSARPTGRARSTAAPIGRGYIDEPPAFGPDAKELRCGR